MIQLDDLKELSQVCQGHRKEGRRIGLVPTMGYLHPGHLSLMRRARELADLVVVSIFVNPAQFGVGEDLDQYPQDLSSDLAKCRAEGVDIVFTPLREHIYPSDYQTYVEVEKVSQGLCGSRRPGHFRGVCTIVMKLFNLVGPCFAVFGQKDYQQLQVIRRMVLDLNMPVEVIGCPIVREPDGLALSSRNVYLNPEERKAALCLSRALQTVHAQALAQQGSIPASEALILARQIIEAERLAKIDYVEVRDAETLAPRAELGQGRSVLALAVFIGKTRLIDNQVI